MLAPFSRGLLYTRLPVAPAGIFYCAIPTALAGNTHFAPESSESPHPRTV
jgi:hypothetical protein